MDERAKHQSRVQHMVQRLSIAAVNYYEVGLVGHVAVSLSTSEKGLSLVFIAFFRYHLPRLRSGLPFVGLWAW